MKTPAGSDCLHYYEDFNRGREVQECRLIDASLNSKPWQPNDCFGCPVPAILRANSSPDLVLKASIQNSGFLWLKRTVKVSSFCSKHNIKIEDPHIGCSKCGEDFRKLFK